MLSIYLERERKIHTYIYIYIYIYVYPRPTESPRRLTPNLPTKIVPAKICRLRNYGEFPMDMRIPPLNIKIMLESNHLKSRILVRRLAVQNRLVALTHSSYPPTATVRRTASTIAICRRVIDTGNVVLRLHVYGCVPTNVLNTTSGGAA